MSNFLTIEQTQNQILAEFEDLEALEKYEYLIDLGSYLPILEPKYKTPGNKINNCQSRTWLVATLFEQIEAQNLSMLDTNQTPKRDDKNLPKLGISQTVFSPNSLSKRLFFTGFSDSQLVTGLIAILWRIYNGQKCEQILQTRLFLPTKLALDRLLTSGRQTGFWEIEKRIKFLAAEELAQK